MQEKQLTQRELKVNKLRKKSSVLQTDEIYDNYKQLCTVLDEPVCNGYSKKQQLKLWQHCFKWERIGNKYKILEIVDMPCCLPLKRKRNSKYSNLIYPIAINLLYDKSRQYSNIPSPPIIERRTYFYDIFGFTNGLYKNLELNDDYEKLILNELRNHCRAIVYELLMRTLENLTKNDKIRYEQHFYITYVNNEEFGNRRYISDQAQYRQIKLYMDTEIELMGYKNINEIFEHNLFPRLKSRINDHLAFVRKNYRFQAMALELFLPYNTDINKIYFELFNDKTKGEIFQLIEANKLEINKLALSRIYNKNNKEIAEMLSYSSAENTVNERLKKEDKKDMKTWNIKLKILYQIRKDFKKDLTIAQCTEIYKQKREEFINEIIKIS
ncbi:MAG: hypothetical protein K2K38_04290 [Clostridia bacterium]|nr:hypothetical protein [Clostridia bacterium]